MLSQGIFDGCCRRFVTRIRDYRRMISISPVVHRINYCVHCFLPKSLITSCLSSSEVFSPRDTFNSSSIKSGLRYIFSMAIVATTCCTSRFSFVFSTIIPTSGFLHSFIIHRIYFVYTCVLHMYVIFHFSLHILRSPY